MQGVPPVILHSILQSGQAARAQMAENRRARPAEPDEPHDGEDVHSPTPADPAHMDVRHAATTPDEAYHQTDHPDPPDEDAPRLDVVA